jgi:glycosyltransferase involved in cell wall biosynthesis
LAEGTGRYLIERGIDPARIGHVPNGVDVKAVHPKVPGSTSSGGDTTTLVYSGAHGPANALGVVLDAAAILAASKVPVRFVLIGDGPEKASLVASASAKALTNVEFREPVPKAELARILAGMDGGLMLLRDAELFSFAVSPNKLFDYLAAAIPVICNVRGEVAGMIRTSGAGIQTSDSSATALVDAILKLRALTIVERSRLGHAGRQWVEQNHSREIVGAHLDRFLRSVISE